MSSTPKVYAFDDLLRPPPHGTPHSHSMGPHPHTPRAPTSPAGSTWARNPIPRINTDNLGLAKVGACTNGPPRREWWSASKDDCQQFESPCPAYDKGWFHCTDGVTQGGCDKAGNNGRAHEFEA
jgi:hypothetical protein